MKPILYESTATNFFNLGLGVLSGCKDALVTEGANAEFYLELKYPLDGPALSLLKNNRIIKADAGHELKGQQFEIKRISKPIKGFVTVYAEHVSYKAKDIPLRPNVTITGDGQTALRQWQNNFIGDYKPFTLSSNISSSHTTSWSVREVENARQALGGVEGSILDTWGGEFKFDNYHISLFRERGRRANAMIAYGRNLVDFEQEESILNTYTSIYPYATWADDDGKDHLITANGYVIDSEHVNKYPNKKVIPVDFTTEFEREEKPTPARLTQLAKDYIKSNDIGVPDVSIRLTHLDLSKSLDYVEYKGIEEINLFDSVMVKFLKIGVDVTAKVVRVVWNVLLERYDEIEIGSVRASISDRLNTIDKKADNALKEATNALNVSVISANGINTVFYGPDEPIATKVGDTWYQEDGTHTILKIWDGVIWRRIIGTDDVEFLKEAIEENNKIVEEAKVAADGALVAGNKAKAAGEDAKKAAVDAQIVGNQAKVAGEEAKIAADGALVAGNEAKILGEEAKVAASEAKAAGSKAEQLATTAQAEALEAKKQADQSFNQINQAISNAGFTSLDALTSDMRTKTSQAQTNASSAIAEAKLLTSEVSGVKGSVTNIGIQIDSIKGTLNLKAGTAEINRIDSTLTTINNQLTYQAGQLSSKISETQLQGAIDGIEIGGRNYLRQETWLNYGPYNSKPIVSNGGKTITFTRNVTSGQIAIGQTDWATKPYGLDVVFTFSGTAKKNGKPVTNSIWNWKGMNTYQGTVLKFKLDDTSGYFEITQKWTTGNNWILHGASIMSGSVGDVYTIDDFMMSKGTKAMDWSPAPEDIDAKITHVESEWKQTASEISGTLSSVSGEVSTQKQTLTSFTQSLMDPNTGRLVKAEQNLNGLQNTVANKANQTDVTTLATGFSVLSKQTVQNLVTTGDDGNALASVWSMGPEVTLASTTGDGFVVTQSVDNPNMTGNNRIFLPQAMTNMENGKNYTVVLEMNPSSASEIAIGQTTGNNIRQNLPSGAIRRLTFTYESNSGNSFSIFFFKAMSYRIRFVSIVEGGGASQGQLSVLNDAINLRVSKGDVVNQINVSTEGILIDGKKTHITGQTTIDSAVIKTAHIDNLAVNSAKITNAAITTAKIGTAQITNALIANLAVDGAKIANAAISTAKIGTAQITNALIANLAVDGAKIANAAITNAKIGNAAIDSAKIADLAVSTAKIANAAINSAKIGTAAIGTAHIGDGVITNAKIGNASINAAKIQDATITAAKIISLDINSATAGTISGANSDWNLRTGRMEFTHPNNGNTLTLTQGDITFKRGTQERKLEYTAEGLIMNPGPNNSGTGLNASIQLNGGGASSYKYLQFGDTTGKVLRVQAIDNHIDLMPSEGGRVRVMTYGSNAYASVEALMFYTNHPSGKTLRFIENRIETPRDGDREILISPQGNAGVRIRNAAGSYYPIYAANFVNSSSRKLKTNIIGFKKNALEVVSDLKVVEYNLISDLDNGVYHRQIGLIAEDSPSVSSMDGLGVDNYRVNAYLIKAVQELNNQGNILDSKVTSLEMYIKGHLEIELNKAKIKIQELEYKLNQMEEIA